MTTPQDPFGPPEDQPGQGAPGGQPYGQPQGSPPPYEQPQGYGSPPSAPPPYGEQQGGWGAPPAKSGTNGMAIASLVTAFLCSPVGIVLGFVAKNQIKQTGQGGNGLATAGIVLGVVFILLNVLLLAGGVLAV